ncbi:Hypothetical_protein [Hexamita inflata]|uniref:Hypothetical_protein n=1 Tax=Hexamita inflata TaxID=28002 RepID=A0AA86RTC0_9EUKA|nr:Hypothetical protein HINF_LOCUS65244 [Hexamita inflata]
MFLSHKSNLELGKQIKQPVQHRPEYQNIQIQLNAKQFCLLLTMFNQCVFKSQIILVIRYLGSSFRFDGDSMSSGPNQSINLSGICTLNYLDHLIKIILSSVINDATGPFAILLLRMSYKKWSARKKRTETQAGRGQVRKRLGRHMHGGISTKVVCLKRTSITPGSRHFCSGCQQDRLKVVSTVFC